MLDNRLRNGSHVEEAHRCQPSLNGIDCFVSWALGTLKELFDFRLLQLREKKQAEYSLSVRFYRGTHFLPWDPVQKCQQKCGLLSDTRY